MVFAAGVTVGIDGALRVAANLRADWQRDLASILWTATVRPSRRVR
jgi:hypothetical protein